MFVTQRHIHTVFSLADLRVMVREAAEEVMDARLVAED